MAKVYVFSNPTMPGIVKIGRTRLSVDVRARQLFNTSVALPFSIDGFVNVDNAHHVEQEVFRRLNFCRVNPRREFFRITPEAALATISNVDAPIKTAVGRLAKIAAVAAVILFVAGLYLTSKEAGL